LPQKAAACRDSNKSAALITGLAGSAYTAQRRWADLLGNETANTSSDRLAPTAGSLNGSKALLNSVAAFYDIGAILTRESVKVNKQKRKKKESFRFYRCSS